MNNYKLQAPYQPNGEPIPTRQELIDQSITEAEARQQAEARAKAEAEARIDNDRMRTLLGLHRPLFYDG